MERRDFFKRIAGTAIGVGSFMSSSALSWAQVSGLGIVSEVAGPQRERKIVEEVLRLLPNPPAYPIVIIDPEGVSDGAAVRRLDAFTVRQPDGSIRPKIYINRESPVFREAVKGRALYRYVLGGIIVHELTHLSGGNEAAARVAESEFFSSLVRKGVVNWEDGVRYLALLKQRDSQSEVPR